MMSSPERLLFLVGPTAIGKSAVALILAGRLHAEIISCDSMQVYKGMDILTSKPRTDERLAIVHHLFDVVSPWQEFDASAYRRCALAALDSVIKKGRLPLFVGGAGLYMSVVLDGLFSDPGRDEHLRRTLLQQASEGMRLHERLIDIDFEAARNIHPNDTRRIIRALEVYMLTGKKISDLQKQRTGLDDDYAARVFGLRMALERLYRRIDKRVDAMFEQGVVDEIRKLLKKKLSRTAAAAIGIQEIKGYLGGAYGEDEARSMMKQATRHYARRQMTWFRKDKRVEWVDVDDGDSPEVIAGRIEEKLKVKSKK